MKHSGLRIHIKISNLLKKWLKEAGVTQTDLSKRLGISQSFVSRILSGRERISNEHIKTIKELTAPSNEDCMEFDRLMSKLDKNDESLVKMMHMYIDVIGGDGVLALLISCWPIITETQRERFVSPLVSELKLLIKNVGQLQKLTTRIHENCAVKGIKLPFPAIDDIEDD